MQLTTMQQARIESYRKIIIARIEKERAETIDRLVARYAATKQEKEKAK